MRVWDVSPKVLYRNHLLGEHRELHAMWSVITKNKKGSHFILKLLDGRVTIGMSNRHEELVQEMTNRGYSHKSPLDKRSATGSSIQEYLCEYDN